MKHILLINNEFAEDGARRFVFKSATTVSDVSLGAGMLVEYWGAFSRE